MYLSTREACQRLRISRNTLAKRIRDGELVAIKDGSARNAHVKVSVKSIEAYERRNRIATVAECV